MIKERTFLAADRSPRIKRAPRAKTAKPCLRYHWCGGTAVSRGLCRSDYNVAREIVEVQRLATWEDFEREGKSLPLRRSAKVWFLEAIPGTHSVAG